MKTIYLVTGAAGHLGTAIVNKLGARGDKVRGLVLSGEKNTKHIEKYCELYYGDVTKRHSLDDFFTHEEDEELYVIHTAGIVSIASKYEQKVYDVNVNGTRNIVFSCLKFAVKRLVYVSSVHAIPESTDNGIITEVNSFSAEDVVGLYAKTKSEATQIVLDSTELGLDVRVVHPSGIIGPGDFGRGHTTQLVIDYVRGSLTAAVDGGYDFVDVRDVADGIVQCLDKGRPGECYILSNKYYGVSEILEMLHEITGIRKIKTILPRWFAKITAPLAELYYKMLRQPPLYTTYSMYTLGTAARFSHEKASKELGYTTKDMRLTLTDTVDWLRTHGRIASPKK